MEVENMTGNRRDDDDDVPLPGFRFHPTDEELVGFYLRRKVEKRPISIELIKQIDIYKHDPWDLPKASNVGDKEWYFFCKRGRKYRNSIRPNRVTGSGFWKATGIDRPIYSAAGEGKDCIGLKKSLVYYRGSAGKGTKTDWMMHEFRLPPNDNVKPTKHIDDNTIAQEAEVWTLCRILKRNISNKKCIPDWREVSSATAKRVADASSKTCSSVESENCQGYISFRSAPVAANIRQNMEKKPFANHHHHVENEMNVNGEQYMRSVAPTSTANSYNYSSFLSPDVNDYLLKLGDWDELKSFVEFAADPFLM